MSKSPAKHAASGLASLGRYGDNILVHMSTDELRGLQRVAAAQGDTLTINPYTGLPEAFKLGGFLKSILPTIAGAALAPFTGGMGAALMVGGADALIEGDWRKGLMAGLGAYGGAGLGNELSKMGNTAGFDPYKFATSNEAQAATDALAKTPGLSDEVYRNTAGQMTGSQLDSLVGAAPAAIQTAPTAFDPAVFANSPEAQLATSKTAGSLPQGYWQSMGQGLKSLNPFTPEGSDATAEFMSKNRGKMLMAAMPYMSQASEQSSAPVRKTKYYRPAPGYKSLWNQGTINPHIAEYGYLPAGEMAYQGQGWNPGVYQDEPGFKSGGEIDEEGLDEEGTRHFVSIGLVPEDPTPYNTPRSGGGSWASADAISGMSENPIMGSGDAGIFDQGSSDPYLDNVLNFINRNQDNNFGVYTDKVYVDPVTGQVLEGYTGDFQTLADYAVANKIDPKNLNSHLSIDQMGSPESILKAMGLPTTNAAPADYPVMDALGNAVDAVTDAYGDVKSAINTGASNLINNIDPLESVVVTGSRYPITSGLLTTAMTGNPMLGWSTYDFLKNGYQPEMPPSDGSSANAPTQGYFDENGDWVWDTGQGTITSSSTGTTGSAGTGSNAGSNLDQVVVTGNTGTTGGYDSSGINPGSNYNYTIDPSDSIDNTLLDQTPTDFTGNGLDEVTVTGTKDTGTTNPFNYTIDPSGSIDNSLLDQNTIDFTGDGLDEVVVNGTPDKNLDEVVITADRWTPGTNIPNYSYNPVDPFTPPPPADFGDDLDEVVISTDRYKPPVIDYPIIPPPVTFTPTTPKINIDTDKYKPPVNVPTKPPGGTTTPPGGTGGTGTGGTGTGGITQVNPVSRRVFDPVAPLNPVPNVRSFDPSSDAQMNDYYRRMWTGASYEPVLNRAPQDPGAFNQFLGNVKGMVQPGMVQEMAGVNPNSGGITSIGGGTQPDPNKNYARGGNIQGGLGLLANTYKAGGRLLRGPGDGMSDSIPAVIKQSRGGMPQRAALADGEFVIPADVVSHLGNGSTEAGSKKLYEMMDRVRHARTGRKAQGKQINPNKFMPK